ncbi:MAG: tRNA (adenosine(37)-N6)-threonylcarbamoyltransferase complex transferase subunit TsaD [Bacteroidota bacterium]|nr:tRNA (adenosine(37)-N6)-threonylcarbamoyltransferase complex transferase subunit TsaD [Bacteroidota bacterium]MDP3145321.1 tRNA (adenosine(37)-N6)-threonylcarbamoyltransferase complex transferase subunit TsaD [Bacteroidota bacterium]MDP3557610.1 tRNA (adenosine(37)-N6)-threonylcarbamoyltransferase complex transferase subunit TsaD [Bacteroidota bacterium]
MQILNTYILAIESSCDDTSCAVLCNNVVLSNITANQKIHEKYGGVVPELASRDHQKNIVLVVQEALQVADVKFEQLNAIAVTIGPGLMGSLLVGLSFAKSMSLSLNIPLIGVNHMQGHVLAHFIKDNKSQEFPKFPFLCLTVSGGHTQLIKVSDYLGFEILGSTIDDAVGEAFDKAAKILGLPYPGGPLIDKFAKEGDSMKFKFSESHVNGYDYSFSGIKTSFLYFIQNNLQKNENFVKENLNDICASYQNHLIQVLLKNVKKLIHDTGIKQLAIAGGVSANSELRKQIKNLEEELTIQTFIPKFEYCTDNAAMIGITAYYKFLNNELSDLGVIPLTRMSI